MKTYGKVIPNLKIDGKPAPYGVVNERAIRATAGIMFVLGFAALMTIRLTGNYTPLYILVPLFWLDFFLKVVLGPSYSIFGFFGRKITANQKPEWVGAIQKRFAWSIGLFMASLMVIFAILLGVRGIFPMTICMTCLLFMWLESACGICAGCKIYGFLLSKGIMRQPEYKPACPGGVCAFEVEKK